MPSRSSTSKRRSQHSGQPSSIRRRNAPSFNSIFEDDSRSNTISLFSFSIPNPLSYFRRSDDDYSSAGPIASYNTTKFILYGGVVFIVLASLFDTYFRTPSQQSGEGEIVGAALPQVTSDGKYHGRYPNSLLTLFYPYTLFRDVVLDQPVDANDVPFFWHAHVSDEIPVKKVLKTCYGADLVELNTEEDVEKAKELKLLSSLVSQGRVGPESLKEKLYNGQRKQPI
eukprot:scaffold988_cov145-Skeletonema_marinoi.AAC.1